MVKTIRIVLEDSEHEEGLRKKGEDTTWREVLLRGLEAKNEINIRFRK